MGDPERIYLQPECCATPDVGRLWCEDDEPVECEEGRPWTEYVRADLAGDPVLAASVAAGMLERHIAALSEARFKCDGTREVSMSWQDAMAFLRSVAHTAYVRAGRVADDNPEEAELIMEGVEPVPGKQNHKGERE